MPKLRPATKPDGSGEPQLFESPVVAAAGGEPQETPEAAPAPPPPVEVEAPAPAPQEEPPASDTALLKQVEATKRSEAIANEAIRSRDEALRLAADRGNQVAKFKQEANKVRALSIDGAIATATAEIAAIRHELKEATSIGDADAHADAMIRLSEAQVNLLSAKNGKASLDAVTHVEEPRVESQPPQTVEEKLSRTSLPEVAKNWLRSNQEYVFNDEKIDLLNSIHNFVVKKERVSPWSPDYFESVEKHLGMRNGHEPIQVAEQHQQRNSIVSAPVSREVPTSTPQSRPGRQNLNADQREAARNSGVTETEYAKQLQKMNEMKANGQLQPGR